MPRALSPGQNRPPSVIDRGSYPSEWISQAWAEGVERALLSDQSQSPRGRLPCPGIRRIEHAAKRVRTVHRFNALCPIAIASQIRSQSAFVGYLVLVHRTRFSAMHGLGVKDFLQLRYFCSHDFKGKLQ